jgi:hypothetical protein
VVDTDGGTRERWVRALIRLDRTAGKDPVKSVIQWPFVWGRPRIRSRAELGKAPPFYSAIDEVSDITLYQVVRMVPNIFLDFYPCFVL